MCRTMLTLLPIVGLVGSNNLSTAIIILGIGVILIFISDPGYARFVGMGSDWCSSDRSVSGSRELPSGKACHMAESGEV